MIFNLLYFYLLLGLNKVRYLQDLAAKTNQDYECSSKKGLIDVWGVGYTNNQPFFILFLKINWIMIDWSSR